MANFDRNDNRTAENPFFNWAKPYFDFVGRGKIYSLVYVIMAFFNLVLPVAVIIAVMVTGLLQDAGPRIITAFILSWLVIAFASWIGFQLWWTRKLNLKRFESADFIATPVISEILQTFGEWVGTFIGILGIGIGITLTILLWDLPGYYIGFGFSFFEMLSRFGPAIIILGPVTGFFIIIIFRFFAEQIRIFSAIANNTREIARNLRKQ